MRNLKRAAERTALAVPLALAAVVPSIAPAHAEDGVAEAVKGYHSAGDLLRKCRDSSSYGRSYCYAYIAAVADSARAYQTWIGAEEPCLPTQLRQSELVDLFEEYLMANPALSDAQAASVIVPALMSAYPCAADSQPTPQ